MKIYRKVIPKIAKDVIRSLLASRAIEVEDGHRDEAELDMAGVLVEYLNDVDRISSARAQAAFTGAVCAGVNDEALHRFDCGGVKPGCGYLATVNSSIGQSRSIRPPGNSRTIQPSWP